MTWCLIQYVIYDGDPSLIYWPHCKNKWVEVTHAWLPELQLPFDVCNSGNHAWVISIHLFLQCMKHIPRCYFFKETHIVSMEFHGSCDASEQAYAAVIYLHMTDVDKKTQISLVTSKTKVEPIKWLTILRLELCGAYLLAQLLHHTKQVFNLPLTQVYAWSDSSIVLSWLIGTPDNSTSMSQTESHTSWN